MFINKNKWVKGFKRADVLQPVLLSSNNRAKRLLLQIFAQNWDFFHFQKVSTSTKLPWNKSRFCLQLCASTRKHLFFSVSTGHKDSVTCAVFSHDSSLVASGDMSGMIKVWKVESKEEIWSFEVGDLEVRLNNRLGLLKYTSSEQKCKGKKIICVFLYEAAVNESSLAFRLPQWLEWHPCAPVLLAGTNDGNVWMWKIPAGDCKTFQSPACQATTGKVLPDGESRRNR